MADPELTALELQGLPSVAVWLQAELLAMLGASTSGDCFFLPGAALSSLILCLTSPSGGLGRSNQVFLGVGYHVDLGLVKL